MEINKPLKIWLLKDGEILPVEKNSKKMRTWKLGEELVDRGHAVTWWSSNFFHMHKKKICEGNKKINIRNNFQLKLIDCGIYKKNISLKRIKHHFLLGKNFSKLAKQEEKPDIIIASLPILEFPIAAIKYAKTHNIPVVIDVRDIWPDVFISYFPSFLKPFLLLPLFLYNRTLNSCLRGAHGIVATHEYFLEWALKKANLKKDENKQIFYLGYDESGSQKIKIIKDIEENIPIRKTIFSYIGCFTNSYEIDLIVKAANILEKDENFNGHFILAGDGDSWNAIKEQTKHSKNITLLGWSDKEQSAYLMNITDVVIIPCKIKTIPNKVFESLFFGKPIIACIEGELKSILENYNAGVYYKKGDVDSLMISIKNLLEENKLEKMKQNSKKLYDEKFSHKKIYTKYCEYIEGLIKKS